VRSRVAAVLIALGLLGLVISGCGGGSGSSTSEASTGAEPAETTEGTETTETTEEKAPEKAEGGGAPASGSLTAPGTELKLGEEATVTYVPFNEEADGKEHQGIETKVTVTAIEEKTQGDLSAIELEPEEKEKTPFFVKAKVEAVGNEPPPDEENPSIRLTAVDDRGQEASSLTILGEFSDCEEEQPPSHFVAGASFETCLIYLVHEGGSVAEMTWNAGPTEELGLSEYQEEPVTWSAAG
jgi:hypothetical protein